MKNEKAKSELASKIEQLLKWKNISQSELAREIGIERSHVNKVIKSVESIKGTPKGFSDEKIRKIANFFNIDYNYLKNGNLTDNPKTSAQTLLNTLEAFGLKEFLMTDDEIYQMEQQEEYLIQNLREEIENDINNLSDEELGYMYYCLEAIISIEHIHYVFLNFMNQLNNQGLDKLSKFMSAMDISHNDSISALPLASKFYRAEMFFDNLRDMVQLEYCSINRFDKVEIIKKSILSFEDEKFKFFADHLQDILTLNSLDWKMLKCFAMLKNRQEVYSTIGYKISANHDVILDYLECLIPVNRKQI